MAPREVDISKQLEKVKAQVDAEFEEWEKANLPPPQSIWRLGHNELMLYVHVHALDNLVRKFFTDEEIELAIQAEFLKNMKAMRPMALKARREALRQSIVDGVNVIRPPEV